MPRPSPHAAECLKRNVVVAMKPLGGRWKLLIVQELLAGARRYSDLRRALPLITPKMLAEQLKALERDGLLTRRELASDPPKVVAYALTPLGAASRPVIDALVGWGRLVRVASEGEASPPRPASRESGSPAAAPS